MVPAELKQKLKKEQDKVLDLEHELGIVSSQSHDTNLSSNEAIE